MDRMQAFVYFSIVIVYTQRRLIQAVCSKIFLSSMYQEAFRRDLQIFLKVILKEKKKLNDEDKTIYLYIYLFILLYAFNGL